MGKQKQPGKVRIIPRLSQHLHLTKKPRADLLVQAERQLRPEQYHVIIVEEPR